MNEDRKKREEQALRSMRDGASGEDGALHGLTRGSAGEGQEALRALLRKPAGSPGGEPDGGAETPKAAEATEATEADEVPKANEVAKAAETAEVAKAEEAADAIEAANAAEGADAADDAGAVEASETAEASEAVEETKAAEGAGTAATADAAQGGLGDEAALRDLFHGIVGGIEPSDNALERLRYAVPARRVRKRRMLVAAAVALLVGTAVPTGMHLTSGTGTSGDRDITAGRGQKGGNKDGESDLHQNGSGSRPKPKRTSDKDKDKGKGTGTGTSDGIGASPTPLGTAYPSTGGTSGTASGGVPVPGTGGAVGGGAEPPPGPSDAPFCTESQLGVQKNLRAPSAGGKVYGSFTVTNVSSRGCTVRGPETLTAGPAAEGGAAVTVLSHATGDPATGLLPDPSVETLRLQLAPNRQYEVRFTWVPSEQGCGSTSGGTADGGSTDSGSTDSGQAADPQKATPPGVTVTHIPNSLGPDGPTSQTTIADACGGTVYRTGVIPLN